ncbi:MAG: hypothetical protein DIJKHBIC_04494 [Thermoanaerobaculia bacterium]|nr:hypothetical protein [Thermoanaerobaculia bacterium]
MRGRARHRSSGSSGSKRRSSSRMKPGPSCHEAWGTAARATWGAGPFREKKPGMTVSGRHFRGFLLEFATARNVTH